MNLLGTGNDVKVLTKRGDGSAALTVAERFQFEESCRATAR